jgi:shikimate dehydrogenase
MPDSYAVIGNPIAQSKSPIIHTMFAAACGHSISYERIEAPIEGFRATVDRFRADGGRGINVTAPFKLDAFAYATDASDAARIAGAANALKFDGERVYAENFDGVGFVRDVVVNLATPIRNKRVLFLGAGGATRGALMPCLAEEPSDIVIANRDLRKSEALARDVANDPRVVACTYKALANERFDIVINATSASLTQALPPIGERAFVDCSLAYDMAYGKGLTPFLALAQESGAAHIADGVGMLVEQAAEAFNWWRGVRPNTRNAIDRLTVPLIAT